MDGGACDCGRGSRAHTPLSLREQPPVRVAFASRGGGYDRLISFAQWVRGFHTPHTHVVLVRGDEVVQANSHGVGSAALSSLKNLEFVDLPSTCDGGMAWLFANSQIGDDYDWLTDISIGVDLLTPTWPSLRKPGTWQCAALVAESLRFGGWLHDWPNIYSLLPSELYEALAA